MDIVTWTCAIQALSGKGLVKQAIDLLQEMAQNGIRADDVTYLVLLTACANSVSIQQGEHILKLMEGNGVSNDFTSGASINFYSKIGQIEQAERVFKEYTSKNNEVSIPLFNVMIDGYAKHGMGKEALDLYNTLLEKNINPTIETISSVLMACSHTGMVEKAKEIYKSVEHSEIWSTDLQISMVDVLARCGLLEEAEKLIGDSKEVIAWSTLLGACRTLNDIERAERAFDILLEIDKEQGSHYVLMSHIYVQIQSGQYDDANKIRELMRTNNAKKIHGITTIEINGETHQFYMEDDKHPQNAEIEKELDKLYNEMIEAGYIPDTKWVTRTEISDEEAKKKLLCRHSEKIALAFAFTVLPAGSPVVMRKNLRMCGDCHSATKFISKIRKCDIVRDASRYHHFKDGKCSCGDFF